MKTFLLSILISLFISNLAISQEFDFRVDKGIIESDDIVEASGIAASSKNQGVLWTHNDSGGKSIVFAFDSTGKHLGNYIIAGIQNRDWEDIAIGPGPIEGEQYLYIGEIGDNSLRYNTKNIYRILEPQVSVDQNPIDSILYDVERIAFQYPDGKHNAETLMIDPLTLDIYVVSKAANSKVYRASWPYTFYSTPTLNVDTLEFIFELPFETAVGGDISPDGKEILIKKTNVIYYWNRNDGQTVEEAFEGSIKTVPYFKEPSGEAVCWVSDLSGYYTISEGWHPHLYFYPRLVTNIEMEEKSIPNNYRLEQNYPNPFNPSTTIDFRIPQKSFVVLKIYNLLGKEMAVLLNEYKDEGDHSVTIDLNDFSSGVYYYQLTTENYSETKKMILLR
ncbi:MAG: T9SS type A sorting domain-containing protein [Ignavibacteriae bacterium]|nr:T9SS type A sorting domain-containing protein [Ignavibacteriota bacterium]